MENQNQKQEKRRKRKKKLLNSIREQIEFYFSDANLRHDRFMRQLIGAEDPEVNGRQSVDLNEFMKFNKISEMTKKIRDISLALESSKCLSLDPNQLTVKRIEPFVSKDTNFDDSTIYVERLPPNADQHWVRTVFGTFGPIEYIKIPHFRHNHNIMGFAFIEFSEPESAQKAVKHFTALSSNDKNQSHSQTDPESDQLSTSSQNDTKTDMEDISYKRTQESDDEEVVKSKRIKVSEENESKEKSETIEENPETNVKKKKKRKRKRKTMTTTSTEDINESEVIHLRVMSKKEWKRWKNKYLKLQKQTMSSIKRSLLVENEDKSTVSCDQRIKKVQNCEDCEDTHFESGLIIKLNFSMPSKDLNEYDFKRNIRQIGGKNEIQYIDLPLNRLEFCANQTVNGICYIRTNSSEDCKRLVDNQKLKQMGDLTLLDGNEETEYWNQIFEQRIKKKSNNNENNRNKTKVRGFDRIINRAENVSTSVDTKPNKHIKFDN